MLYNFIILGVYFIEMLIAYIFFSQIGERKKAVSYCLFWGTLIFGSGALINIIFSNLIWLNATWFVLINSLFAFLFFRIKLKKVIFYSVILNIFSTALEFVAIFFISAITNVEVTAYLNQISFLLLEGSISKGLYFFVCIVLSRFIKKENNIKFPISLYMYPVTVICSLLVFWYICANFEIGTTSQILLSFVSAILFFSTVILFITYQHNIEKENELFQLKNEFNKIKTEKNYYDILEKQNYDLMIYAHDAKNHLSAIKSLNTDPQIDEYINKMAESLATYSKVSHSGNHTLDVIINKYITECEIKNVKFSFDIRLKNLEYVEDYDLVTILGNLLDNALEAAENSQNSEITLSTDYRNTYDVIIITNSCDVEPKSINEKLLTTKKDKRLHGIGLKSVMKTLKEYSGDYDWEYDSQNKIFTSIVMLSNSKK